jgi:sigma-B regulation protein RsbU (phosphoserine phosphatase)
MTSANEPFETAPMVPERMQCMEVWGGNQVAAQAFQMPGLDVWLYSQPHLQADQGGDVYYISSCASGRITRALLADVSGHGAGVSQLAGGLRNLMRRNVNVISQSRFVEAMNQQFGQLAENGGFATAVLATFFSPQRTLTLSNAGHPLPLLLRHGSDRWVPLAQGPANPGTIANTPLGVVEAAEYSGLRTQLAPGDKLLCYSDALSEARDQTNNMLGVDGLSEELNQLTDVASAELIPRLLKRIADRRPDNLTEDDVTVLLLQATGSQPSLKDNVLAPWRLLSGVNDATRLGRGEG